MCNVGLTEPQTYDRGGECPTYLILLKVSKGPGVTRIKVWLLSVEK